LRNKQNKLNEPRCDKRRLGNFLAEIETYDLDRNQNRTQIFDWTLLAYENYGRMLWVGERIIAMKTERTTKMIKLINLLKNLIKLIN